MRKGLASVLAGAVVLAGCASPRSSGIEALEPGRYGLTVTGGDLGAAAAQALSEATGFCNRQGRQAALLQSRINPGDYRLAFRCQDEVDPAALRRGPGDDGPPPAAPIHAGPAPAPAAPARADTPRRTAPMASGLPPQPPTLGALAAASRPLPPEPAMPPPRRDLFRRLFSTDDRLAPDPASARVPDPVWATPAAPPVPGQMAVPPAGFWDLRRR